MEERFKLKTGVLEIFLPKEVDHHNAEEIRRTSDHLLEKSYVNSIIFDFKETDFMDSSGVGMVLGRYKTIHFMGGNVFVRNVNARVDRMLAMAGVYRLIWKRED